MLVLSRKSNESIVIGGGDGLHRVLRITVLEVGHGKVKLGFDVDGDVPVHRAEVWARIHSDDVLVAADSPVEQVLAGRPLALGRRPEAEAGRTLCRASATDRRELAI